MHGVLLKTQERLETTGIVLSNLYSVIGFLVLWDVMTTYINMFILAESFGEYGLIANIMIHMFGWAWGIVMLPIEFAIFALITYLFSKSNHIIKVGRKNISLKYLPAIALAVIIINNLANLTLFLILSNQIVILTS